MISAPRSSKIERRRVIDALRKWTRNGGYEVVKIFSGTRAQQLAISYAKQEFGEYDMIWLKPYWLVRN
jgi:hypothetical protein